MSFTPRFGWINDPAAVARVLARLPRPDFRAAAPHLTGSGAGQDVFAWECEQKVFGRLLAVWDQSSIGSCVSHGSGRSAQDVCVTQLALGSAEQWPGAEVCREAIYGGSRVQVGHQGGDEDGSTGAWAAEWVSKWGVLFYLKYGSLDLTSGYTVERCRDWGARGCPASLEGTARQHPVKTVSQTTTAEAIHDAVANGHWVAICGNVSRTMQREPGGWCPAVGNDWPHCQEICGCCVVKGGKPALLYRNSWGDYLGSENNRVTLESGREVELPPGCYLSDYESVERDARQGDTFAYSAFVGFPAQRLDWVL
jgi:hypothetical protein